MSLLTPLYLTGLLAVSLPVLFHLIRRTPRGRQAFSSLMFLTPSPPRLTRRSRLDQVLLLLLRAAVLILLALAFARPFLRQSARLGVDERAGRRIAVLLDTSASMRRGDLWRQAVAKVQTVLGDVGPGDRVALFAFDSHVRRLAALDDPQAVDPVRQVGHLRAQVSKLAPTWAATDLGQALVRAADEINRAGAAEASHTGLTRQVILISDLQEGSRLDALQTYEWPDDVLLTVETVAPLETTNAGVQLAGGLTDDVAAQPMVRIRLSNDRASHAQQFELRWAPTQGPPADAERIGVYVPPGESRVVRMPRISGDLSADRLLLSGDDHVFDNAVYLVPVRQEEVPLVYIGSERGDDPTGLRYYLERAFPQTARRKVNVLARRPDERLTAEDLGGVRLAVVCEALPPQRAADLRQYMLAGGTLLFVLQDARAAQTLAQLMGRDDLPAEEATGGDYAMLGQIAFAHPLFAAFADPRFNDFTKIHFWKHRRVDIDAIAHLEVLARFDDGDPALFEQTHQEGRLLVLTSGWHPSDSQLARSTKFVPLLAGILERSGSTPTVRSQYQVGDRVILPDRKPTPSVKATPGGDETTPGNQATGVGKALRHRTVAKPDGSEILLGAGAKTFDALDQPGIYRLVVDGERTDFAVNLAAAESKTAPLDPGELEQLGVRLGRKATPAELAEKQRQMHDIELENRQKLWQWLVIAAMALLVVETWLAGYLTRSTDQVAGVS